MMSCNSCLRHPAEEELWCYSPHAKPWRRVILCPRCFIDFDEPEYVPPIRSSELGSLAGSYFDYVSEHRSQYLLDSKATEDSTSPSNELLFLETINRAQPDYIKSVVKSDGDRLIRHAKGQLIRSLIFRISNAMKDLDADTYAAFNRVMS